MCAKDMRGCVVPSYKGPTGENTVPRKLSGSYLEVS